MNRKLAVVATVLLAAGSLTACGSSAPRTDITTYPTANPPLTLRQVAEKAGCSEMTLSAEVGTKEGATCKVGGHDLYLYTFADDSARNAWLKAGKAAGALGSFQQGESWVIQTL